MELYPCPMSAPSPYSKKKPTKNTKDLISNAIAVLRASELKKNKGEIVCLSTRWYYFLLHFVCVLFVCCLPSLIIITLLFSKTNSFQATTVESRLSPLNNSVYVIIIVTKDYIAWRALPPTVSPSTYLFPRNRLHSTRYSLYAAVSRISWIRYNLVV